MQALEIKRQQVLLQNQQIELQETIGQCQKWKSQYEFSQLQMIEF